MNETKAIETTENAPAEVMEQKPYTFRKLSADDIFLMVSIISKIGIREFKACLQDETIGKLVEKFTKANAKAEGEEKDGEETAAMDNTSIYTVAAVALLPAVDIILGNMERCKDDVYALLSDVSGMKVDEIRADAILFMEMLIDFFKKPEFPGFIKVVSGLLK